jgi:hypothetical protein
MHAKFKKDVKLRGGHINIYIWEICYEMEAEWKWQDLILAVSKLWDLLPDIISGSVTVITNLNVFHLALTGFLAKIQFLI